MGRWMENMLTMEVETESEQILYVEWPPRSYLFLAFIALWKLLESTQLPNVLRTKRLLGTKPTEAELIRRYPWAWGVPVRARKGCFKQMSPREIRHLHWRNTW